MGAEIPDGAVLVARAILNSSIWTMRAEDRLVAITCICLANWRPRSWFNGKEHITIGKGQFVRSWEHLAEACKLSVQSVRTSVKNLQNVGFLTRKLTGHVQLFTIPKYSHYQDLTKYSDQIALETNKVPNSDLTGVQQQPNSALTTNNNLIREEGKKEGGKTPSSPLGMLLAKAKAQSIPGKEETLRTYLQAWVTRTDYTRAEQIIMDPWSAGKTVIEIQDHFFPKQANGVSDKEFAERRDSAYRKV